MNTQLWAKRAVVGSLTLWLIVVTAYIVLGSVQHEVLPQPYNVMILLVLATFTSASGAAWYSSRIEVRLGRVEGALLAAADRADAQENRHAAHLMHIMRRLDDLEAPTVQLSRSLVAVGSARVPDAGTYRQGYEDAMAARPDAKVIPLGAATHHP